MKSEPEYLTVRRRSDAPFRVLPIDLVSEEPQGYDLSLVRSMAVEGLTTPITVCPLPDGRFRVIDGSKRLAAIRVLVQMNKVVYDTLRRLWRPARQVFRLIYCRI
jgi:ParB-like nuclease domain